MKINFWKYQGNGNDFIIMDEWRHSYILTEPQIVALCDRHFGIGADGLMRLSKSKKYDFKMQYYNADGQLASMCGNGGRCIAAFAFMRKYVATDMMFSAFDGPHHATVLHETMLGKAYNISLEMTDVKSVETNRGYYFLDTGSPHYVEFTDKVAEMDVVTEGRKTRNSELFAPDGTNVDFVEISGNRLFVRTYERGVEDETLSCGTGVTASALAAFLKTGKQDFSIHTSGGDFKVDFQLKNGEFTRIRLIGPATFVFSGTFDLL